MQVNGPADLWIRIRPPQGWVPLDPRELWRYRQLLWILAWRDLTLRYKRTLLGAGWALVQPLMMVAVFSIFLGRLGGLPSEGLPYPVFVYCALLPWQLFATALTQAASSTVSSENLITKVYFPRLLIPLSAITTGLVDFAIGFVLLLGIMIRYSIPLGWRLLNLPWLLLLTLLAALSVGLWFSALNVQYRDFGKVVPFFTQLWLFVTPVVYPSAIVPERWRAAYGLNPMAGVVEGFRWAVLGQGETLASTLWISSAVVLLLLVGGLYYYRRMEQYFADIV